MNIIFSAGKWNIYTDGIETFDKLPAKTYKVCFSDREGFFLTSAEDVHNTEKVYGDLLVKTLKVFNAYDRSQRSVGVLMSGEKGIGKTMMARLICEKAMERGLPVIIIQDYVPGIASFIGSINQPALLLFDEFEKMFGQGKDRRGDSDAGGQPEMLSLLDGLYSSKWLFVMTCNREQSISQYLVGRPGRIHYHFRFTPPTATEIEEYLKDNIPAECFDQIPKVITFARFNKINYDALRAIAFEFQLGGDFDTFVKDLNIEQRDDNIETDMYAVFNNGVVVHGPGCNLCIGSRNIHRYSFGFDGGACRGDFCYIIIRDSDIIPSTADDAIYEIDPKKLPTYKSANDAEPGMEAFVDETLNSGIKRIVIIPRHGYDISNEEWEGLVSAFKRRGMDDDGNPTWEPV